MEHEPNSRKTSAIFHIAGLGASLAFGAMVATLFALRSVPDGFGFEINLATVLAFVAAASLAWFYWRLVERMATDRAPEQRRKKFLLFSAGLVLVGIVSFLYPLKFIPAEKRFDVFFGLALAVVCISGIGFVMWRVKKFLDADLKKSEEDHD